MSKLFKLQNKNKFRDFQSCERTTEEAIHLTDILFCVLYIMHLSFGLSVSAFVCFYIALSMHLYCTLSCRAKAVSMKGCGKKGYNYY